MKTTNPLTGSSLEWPDIRKASIEALDFPYQEFRKGQRELSVAVYKTIRAGSTLLARAPTGTGKTIATLFPAIKALGMGFTDKIFYLTAKTIGRTMAEKAMQDMQEAGVKLRSITITAKEKICFNAAGNCTSRKCKYIAKYKEKLEQAVPYALEHYSLFTRQIIEEIAREFTICPFELSLDISLECACIICDYNYAFDLRVALKRYFDKIIGSYTFLVDEAHNLPDRLRNIYGVSLSKKQNLAVRRHLKDTIPDLADKLTVINTILLAAYKTVESNNPHDKEPATMYDHVPTDLIEAVKDFTASAEEHIGQDKSFTGYAEFQDLYYHYQFFITLCTVYSTGHIFCYRLTTGKDLQARIICNDPAPVFKKAMKKCSAAVFFSATLYPLEYFRQVLLGEHDGIINHITAPSPFDPAHFKLLIHKGISTRYKDRQASLEEVAAIIQTVCTRKKGNYLVFFPSYAYLDDVVELILKTDSLKNTRVQARSMDEKEREDFLQAFNKQDDLTGFAVLGGIFGEGIDLTGTDLIGVIIIGVGLPQICLERDLIRNYFNVKKMDGFAYSYTLPGFNRVLQATGRVIRTESDRGIALLIDDRFASYRYTSLFLPEWSNMKIVNTPADIEGELDMFWSDNE